MDLVKGIQDQELREYVEVIVRDAEVHFSKGRGVWLSLEEGRKGYRTANGHCYTTEDVITVINEHFKGFMTNPLIATILKDKILNSVDLYYFIRD